MFGKTLKGIVVVTVAMLGQLGCQNSKPTGRETTAYPERAVVVTGGNGGSVTVFVPSADPANPMALCTEGATLCPECKAAAVKFFQTGILEPKCSRTGAVRTATYAPQTVAPPHN
jgi:hypothetical protein